MAHCVERPAAGPFCLHVAEGVDAAAGQELAILDERGLLNDRLIAVHAVGVRARDVDHFRRSGAALAWCPTSNDFLFGRTASRKLLDSGCDLLLGSDSRLTGAGDLLDELRAARSCNAVDDERLAAAVGATCARRLRVAEPSLEPGSRADLILLARPLMEARSSDVALTVVNGITRVAREDVARQLGRIAGQGSTMRVGGVERWANEQGRMNR